MMAGGGRRTNEAGARAVVEGLFGPEPARAAPRHAPAASPAPVAGYASVALNRPMRNVFTYGVPRELDERVRVGVRVSVLFAGRREIGVVVERTDSTDVLASRIKPLREVLDDEPAVGAEMLELTRWISDYYACSWGEALAAALPAALKREGGRKTVAVYAAAPGVDESRLGELEGKALAKQHRVLRTLLCVATEVRGAHELRARGLARAAVDVA